VSAASSFRHQALLYAGDADFVDRARSFLAEGVAAGEPSLVVVSAHKIGLLREALGEAAEKVDFADMADVGSNPARIIPAWQEFVTRHRRAGRLRGIGEPIWAARQAQELVECQLHESLLNDAFAGTDGFWLLCPYDTESLSPDVVDEALRSHPHLMHGDDQVESPVFGRGSPGTFASPLPEPQTVFAELPIAPGSLGFLRRAAARQAASAGFSSERTAAVVAAVDEVVTNTLVHGGGSGTLRFWRDADRLVCEVRDGGRLEEPLLGRRRPGPDPDSPRGLWLVNQLCDLVQLRSYPEGTVVRLHLRAG
jgi:anti-sigma regulatory factor (Ser/Thr protein kinase)